MKIGQEAELYQSFPGRLALSSLVLVLLMMLSLKAFGQQDEGTITGIVSDSTGAVIANATVALIQGETGFTTTQTSDSKGVFTASPLKIGVYRMKVSAAGFETVEQRGLVLHAQERLNVNVTLKIGSASETVVVNTAAVEMQTQEASVGQTIAAQTVVDTPLNERNYTYIAQLAMGVMPATQGSRGELRGDFTANGQRSEQNNFILDGVDNNVNLQDFLNGASWVIKPPPEALQEFGVLTTDYSAELGHAAGGVINASIKSGTNSFHGSAWEFFRNDRLNDTDWFTIKKPEYHGNQFGATFGGPIFKNKLFFFGDAEENRIIYQEASNFYSVPTDEMRDYNGAAVTGTPWTDFTEFTGGPISASAYPASASGIYNSNGVSKPLYTPGGGSLLACYNNTVDTLCPGATNSIATALLNAYPRANYPNVGTHQTFNNYLFEGQVSDMTTQYDTRLDWNPRANDQAFARYSYSQEPQFYPSPLGPVLDGGSFGADGHVETEGRNFTMSETHIFTPKVVNEARFGYNWLYADFKQENGGTDLSSTYGLGGIPYGPLNGGLPAITMTPLTKAGSPSFFPSVESENVIQGLDNVTTSLGNHSVKFGIALMRIRTTNLQPTSPRGALTASGAYSDSPAASSTSGAGIIDFLLDNIASGSINNIFTTVDQRWYNAAYVQDDWRITRTLTLNLGLRWEFTQPYREVHGFQANFVPAQYTSEPNTTYTSGSTTYAAPGFNLGSGTYLIPAASRAATSPSGAYPLPAVLLQNLAANHANVQYDGNNTLLTNYYDNFAPRIGLAYSPTNKLVIRAGWGIFYGGLEPVGYGINMGENPPFIISDSIAANSCTSPSNCPASAMKLETGFTNQLGSNGAVSTSNLVDPGVKSYAASNKTAYTESYNLSIQYQLSSTMAATIGYVGNVDDHLHASSSYNTYDGELPPGTSYSSFTPLGGGVAGSSSNYTKYGLSGGGVVVDSGIGNYNALQSKFEKHISHGLSFTATYDWTHALDDARPPLNGYAGQAAYRLPQWLGIHYDYGTDLQDVRQRATLNGHYVLPVGKGQRWLNQGGVTDEILGGWQTSLTFRVQTGNPLELVGNNTLGNGTSYPLKVGNPFSNNISTAPNTGITACALKTKSISLNASTGRWFNPCAFNNPTSVTAANYDQLPLSSFLGVQGSTNVVGPGYNRADLSIFKNFSLIHESDLNFRADFFNVYNTPAHGQPATSVAGGGGAETNQTQNGAFGQITSERFHGEQPDSRVIQLSMELHF
jgi:Carboxypeptidase regulatory-like domain